MNKVTTERDGSIELRDDDDNVIYTLKRNESRPYKWVMRNKEGIFIDDDQYRNDLIAKAERMEEQLALKGEKPIQKTCARCERTSPVENTHYCKFCGLRFRNI